jgi:hypothetical protein
MGFAFKSPAHLPEIAGLIATIRPDFDRERWTTCSIGHLDVGEVFAMPADHSRPVVLVEKKTVEVSDGYITTAMVVGEVRYIDTGEAVPVDLRANTSVLTRCDLVYATKKG